MSRRHGSSRKKPRLEDGSDDAPLPGPSHKDDARLKPLQDTARQILSGYISGRQQGGSSRTVSSGASSSRASSSVRARATDLMQGNLSDSESSPDAPAPAPRTGRDNHGRFTKKQKGKRRQQVQPSASFLANVSRAHNETVYGFKDRRRHDEVPPKPSIKATKATPASAPKEAPTYRIGQLSLVPYPPELDGSIDVPEYPVLRAYGLAKTADSLQDGISVPSNIGTYVGYMRFLREHFPDFDAWADEECTRIGGDITASAYFLAFKVKGKQGKFTVIKPTEGHSNLFPQTEYKVCTYDASNDWARRKLVLVSRHSVPQNILKKWFYARNSKDSLPPRLRDEDISSPSPSPPPVKRTTRKTYTSVRSAGHKRRRASLSSSSDREETRGRLQDAADEDVDAVDVSSLSALSHTDEGEASGQHRGVGHAGNGSGEEDGMEGSGEDFDQEGDDAASDEEEGRDEDVVSTRPVSPAVILPPSRPSSAAPALVATSSTATVVEPENEQAHSSNLIYASLQSLSMSADGHDVGTGAMTGLDFAPAATSTPIDVDIDLTGNSDNYVSSDEQSSEEEQRRRPNRRVLPSREQAPFRPVPTFGLSQAYDPFA